MSTQLNRIMQAITEMDSPRHDDPERIIGVCYDDLREVVKRELEQPAARPVTEITITLEGRLSLSQVAEAVDSLKGWGDFVSMKTTIKDKEEIEPC